jgi:proline iminopeptidase
MRSSTLLLLAGLLSCVPAALPAQEVPTREGYVLAADSVRLFYRVYGDRGDTIIYLHGGPGGSLERQMPNLLRLAVRHVVIAYDQRGGNGRSDAGDTTRITPATHVADLEAVRRHFGVERPTLMGHSWGTGLAVLYADAHPRNVARLILNGPMPPARTPFDAQRWEGVSARIAAQCAAILGPAATDAQSRTCQQRPNAVARVYFADTLNMSRDRGREREGGPGVAVGNRATLRALGDWDFRPVLRRIQVPALVVEGAQTPVPLDQVRLWAQELGNGRLLLIEGAGHGYPYIENPEAFFPAIDEFLAGRWPRDAVQVRASPE